MSQPNQPQHRKIQVIETATGEVVHEVDVTGQSEHNRNKVFWGMMRNLNHDEFHLREWPMETNETQEAGNSNPL